MLITFEWLKSLFVENRGTCIKCAEKAQKKFQRNLRPKKVLFGGFFGILQKSTLLKERSGANKTYRICNLGPCAAARTSNFFSRLRDTSAGCARNQIKRRQKCQNVEFFAEKTCSNGSQGVV